MKTYTIHADNDTLCMGDIADIITAAVAHHVTSKYSGKAPAGIEISVNYSDRTILVEDRRAPAPRIPHAQAQALRKMGMTNEQILQIATVMSQADHA